MPDVVCRGGAVAIAAIVPVMQILAVLLCVGMAIGLGVLTCAFLGWAWPALEGYLPYILATMLGILALMLSCAVLAFWYDELQRSKSTYYYKCKDYWHAAGTD